MTSSAASSPHPAPTVAPRRQRAPSTKSTDTRRHRAASVGLPAEEVWTAHHDVEDPAESSARKPCEDFLDDQDEPEARHQTRQDAHLTTSTDSVRAYLNQIGKIALLTEQEVDLAKRIEAGLYAAHRLRHTDDAGVQLCPQLRRDLQTSSKTASAPKATY